jgi:hypothetical protein
MYPTGVQCVDVQSKLYHAGVLCGMALYIKKDVLCKHSPYIQNRMYHNNCIVWYVITYSRVYHVGLLHGTL